MSDAVAWLMKLATWKFPSVFDRDLVMRTLTGR